MTTLNYVITNIITQTLICLFYYCCCCYDDDDDENVSSSVFEGMKKAEFTYQETTL